MNILIIGNGFDIAHGLPTRYADFLCFCDIVIKIYDAKIYKHYFMTYMKSNKIYNLFKEELFSAFENRKEEKLNETDNSYSKGDSIVKTTNNGALDELHSHIVDNIWIEYFMKIDGRLGENWIDFESEIAKIIRALDTARPSFKRGQSLAQMSDLDEKNILTKLTNTVRSKFRNIDQQMQDIDNFTFTLNSDLERLTRALEIYIAKFVSGITINKKNTDIEKLDISRVLSFNYSNVYKKVYNKDVECCYIHGEADIEKNVKNCNLVLGIDADLSDQKEQTQLESLTFKKFYQRIYKATDNDYQKWLDDIRGKSADHPQEEKCEEDDKNHNLYIFGHSLDVTDKDILEMFICNDNVKTKIFYYRKHEDDKIELGKLIKNLVKLLGPKELVRRTGGPDKTIEFIPQSI